MTGIVVTLVLLAAAADPAALAAEAEAAFVAGRARLERGESARADLHRAVAALERLWQTNVSNQLLHRKLGDCYLLTGDLPRAMLHYRIGERIDPNDPELRASLEAALDQVVVDERSAWRQRAPGWAPLMRYVPPRPTIAVAVGLYTAAWALAAWWLVRRRTLVLLVAAALLLLAAGLTALLVDLNPPLRPIAVVARDDVPVRQGDGAAYSPVSERVLHRGHDLDVLYRRGDWLQVALPRTSAPAGWVHVRDVVLADEAGGPGTKP